ncbi:MAG: hypothetical protein IPJ77_04675 [Planctomycetes bacterium]|nr:hypothetical protein [Planctomycetota bacterium]
MNEKVQEFESALALIREAQAVRQPLNRYHARAVLLPLGELLSAEDPAAGRSGVEELRRLIGPVRAGWRKAVEDELEMAITEFAMSIDQRYLARPDYDFAYTLEARRRISVRLAAARALEIELPAIGERALSIADREFAPYLDRARPG